MNFQNRNSYTSLLFRKTSVSKFNGKINLDYILFISKSTNNFLPSQFNNWFVFSPDTRQYNTLWSPNDKLQNFMNQN